MILTLRRDSYFPDCTLGVLEVAGRRFATIENPKEPDGPGLHDKHDICLPAGTYRLISMTRASGEKAYAIVNPQLRVWHLPSEVPSFRRTDARSAVYLAAGFCVDDVVGSHIAPGKDRIRQHGRWRMDSSRDAMNEIRTLIGARTDVGLLIEDGI